MDSVFSPHNEPYLGRESVYYFDGLIISCMEINQKIAKFTHENELNSIQRAASQIIPQGINLALTIRELVRQGYLFGALVLQRPFIERVAIISYLNENRDKIHLWENGWEHGKRPSLKEMLKTMSGGENEGNIRTICDTFNHLVHGDPVGADWNLVQTKTTGLGYSVGKVIDDFELCDFICAETSGYMIVLMGVMGACFHDVK
jgi:hypothetical protein